MSKNAGKVGRRRDRESSPFLPSGSSCPHSCPQCFHGAEGVLLRSSRAGPGKAHLALDLPRQRSPAALSGRSPSWGAAVRLALPPPAPKTKAVRAPPAANSPLPPQRQIPFRSQTSGDSAPTKGGVVGLVGRDPADECPAVATCPPPAHTEVLLGHRPPPRSHPACPRPSGTSAPQAKASLPAPRPPGCHLLTRAVSLAQL